jgi:hypothetical protein
MSFSQDSVTENFMDPEITSNWKYNTTGRKSFERNISFTRYGSFNNQLNFSERQPFIPTSQKYDNLFNSQNSIGSSGFPKCDFPNYQNDSSECFVSNTKANEDDLVFMIDKSDMNEKKENVMYLKEKEYEVTSIDKESDSRENSIKVEEIEDSGDEYLKAEADDVVPILKESDSIKSENEKLNKFRKKFSIFSDPLEKIDLNDKEKKLAIRNIKLNFGTGLIQFIDFKKERAAIEGNKKRARLFSKIIDWLRIEQGNFRSFDGWRDLYKDPLNGKHLRIMACVFFGKNYAKNYVNCARIRPEYKLFYRKKIKSFLQGAKNPDKFTPSNF